jgi:ribose transport system substrate-binding protein
VVIIDSALKSDDRIAYVATNNRAGGRKAGEHLAQLLGGTKSESVPQDLVKKVLMLRYQTGSASTMEREEGFLEALKPFGNLRVVSENQRGGATVESAMKAAENLLTQYEKDGQLHLDGIFCPNESTTFGMLRVLQDRGYAGKVKLVGFDVTAKLLEALNADQIHGLMVQDPFMMGYKSVHTIVGYIRGGEPEKEIDTGVVLVTKANLNQPQVQSVVAPPLKQWLEE